MTDPISTTTPIDAQTARALIATDPRQSLVATSMNQDTLPKNSEQAIAQLRDIFLGFMIQSMRETVPENELIPKSTGEKMFEAFLDQEYTCALGKQMGEDMITAALRRQLIPEQPPAASHARIAEIEARARAQALPPIAPAQNTPIANQKEENVR